MGWEFTAIAFQLLDGLGTYRVITDGLEKYFLLTEEINRTEKERIDNESIECVTHGMGRHAYVCQHLNTESKVGFE
jgi:hypothetical protein